MMVQAHDGRLRYYEGSRLPDEMVFFTGAPHKGRHVGECFPRDLKSPTSWSPAKAQIWPTWRDVVHVAVGVVCIGLLSFISSVAHAAFSGM